MDKKEREYWAKRLSEATDWKEARRKEMRSKKKEDVNEFVNSPRGNYIISQALCIAVDKLRSRPEREREESNIMDMEYLIEHAFPIYESVSSWKEAMDELLLKEKKNE